MERPKSKEQWLDQIIDRGTKIKKHERKTIIASTVVSLSLVAALAVGLFSIISKNTEDTPVSKPVAKTKKTTTLRKLSASLSLPSEIKHGQAISTDFSFGNENDYSTSVFCVDMSKIGETSDCPTKTMDFGYKISTIEEFCNISKEQTQNSVSSLVSPPAVSDLEGWKKYIENNLNWILSGSEKGKYTLSILAYSCDTKQSSTIYSQEVEVS